MGGMCQAAHARRDAVQDACLGCCVLERRGGVALCWRCSSSMRGVQGPGDGAAGGGGVEGGFVLEDDPGSGAAEMADDGGALGCLVVWQVIGDLGDRCLDGSVPVAAAGAVDRLPAFELSSTRARRGWRVLGHGVHRELIWLLAFEHRHERLEDRLAGSGGPDGRAAGSERRWRGVAGEALIAWIQNAGYRLAGSSRELYHEMTPRGPSH
jgi:hypothetical protein